MTGPVPAKTITIAQTLVLLDGRFQAFAEGVSEDRYVLWLGSGISLGRVGGVKEIVQRVMEFLRTKVEPRNPTCRFRSALNEVLEVAGLSDEEKQRIDFAQPFSKWDDAVEITRKLVGSYALLLDTPIIGESEDFLLWDGADVVSTFADPGIEPDVEHLCIAILILEGVASNIASANWDGLVEKAVDVLTNGKPTVVVCVRPEDLRKPDLRTRLLKFHGCAVMAREDEDVFRRYLVARHSQIHGWTTQRENSAMVGQLINLVTTKPALVMGLSAQDANVQAIFSAAQAQMPWPWPGDRPSCVFSEDIIQSTQRTLLRNVYRDTYAPETYQQIMDGALIQAYANSLLVALVLHVLCSKLKMLIRFAPGMLSDADRKHLEQGVVTIRDQLAFAADGDRLVFVRQLIDRSSRTIMLFRDGKMADGPETYYPVTPTPTQKMAGDASLLASGLSEAAVATGILGIGVSDRAWTLEMVDGDEAGVVRVNSAAGSATVYLVANSHAALCLRTHGHLIEGDDTVVVHCLERVLPQPRSPHCAPGRTGWIGVREVSIAELMKQVDSSAALIQRFREEVAI